MDSPLDKRAYVFSAIGAIAALQYYCLAAMTILYYDYLLTIKDEVELIWKKKLSSVSCIYLLNRYLTLLGYIVVVYFIFNSPIDIEVRCTKFARFPGALSTITQVFVVVLLVMRVYALYQRRIWVLWATIPFGVATIVIAAWGLTQVVTVNLSFGRQAIFKACVPSDLKSSTIFKVSWFINGAFDTLILALTVYKTCSMVKQNRQVGLQSNLAKLLMRDGGMFFGILAVANLVNVIFYLVDQNTFFEESAGNNSVLTHTLTSTLLSRLILNLREVGSRQDTDATRLSTRLSIATHPEDIMLVSASTFSNTTATRNSDYTCSSTLGKTAPGSSAVIPGTPALNQGTGVGYVRSDEITP